MPNFLHTEGKAIIQDGKLLQRVELLRRTGNQFIYLMYKKDKPLELQATNKQTKITKCKNNNYFNDLKNDKYPPSEYINLKNRINIIDLFVREH